MQTLLPPRPALAQLLRLSRPAARHGPTFDYGFRFTAVSPTVAGARDRGHKVGAQYTCAKLDWNSARKRQSLKDSENQMLASVGLQNSVGSKLSPS